MSDRRLRLLVIEDSADDAGLVVRALERGGYKIDSRLVDSVPALRDALASGGYDLAITDHNLPGFDSLDALGILEEAAPDLPCVLVSGKIGEEVVGRAMRMGAADYVPKDLLGSLPAAVARVLVEKEQRLERQASEEALARSARLFEAVFVNARDTMLIVNGERQLVDANPAACELTGLARDRLLALEIDSLMPGEWRVDASRAWTEFLRAGQRRGEAEILRSDGALVATEYTAAANFLPGLHIIVMRDITERRAAEADVKRHSSQQKAIAELGERALQEKSLDLLADAVVSRVAATLDVKMVSFHEMDDLGGFIVRSQVGLGAKRAGRRTAPGSPDSSQIAFSARQEAAVVVADYDEETRFPRSSLLESLGVRSGLTVAIPGNPGTFGVLAVAAKEPNAFSDDDATFLTAVAHLLSDAWERSRSEEAARTRALHDALTGLPNRSLFFDRLKVGLRRCKRAGTRLAIIAIDIDHFKVLNDTLGHRTADQLLVQVGERITEATREIDTVARLGSDEFTVLCENVAREDEVRLLTTRILAALEAPFEVEGEPYTLTASVGVAWSDSEHLDADSLLRDADIALHRSKESGRGAWTLATEEMRVAVIERADTVHALERAIAEEGLALHYQPIVDLEGGGISSAEALLRWEHPERGLIPPNEFIPLAEESSLIIRVGEWVLRAACAQAARWRADFGDTAPLPIHVNFSARQIAQAELPAFVLGVLAETGVPPSDIAVEMTETALIDNVGTPIATLGELNRAGLHVALDDFGTGYSSLSYLERFPIDSLKIDRAFISGLGAEGAPTAIISAIVGIAGALQLDTVAEGVETAAEAGAVSALGVSHAQGYFFGRPVPAGEIEELVRDDSSLRAQVAEAHAFATAVRAGAAPTVSS